MQLRRQRVVRFSQPGRYRSLRDAGDAAVDAVFCSAMGTEPARRKGQLPRGADRMTTAFA